MSEIALRPRVAQVVAILLQIEQPEGETGEPGFVLVHESRTGKWVPPAIAFGEFETAAAAARHLLHRVLGLSSREIRLEHLKDRAYSGELAAVFRARLSFAAYEDWSQEYTGATCVMTEHQLRTPDQKMLDGEVREFMWQ